MNLLDKPTLVLTDDQTLALLEVKEELEKYFFVKIYDPDTDYDTCSTLIVINSVRKSEYYQQILNSNIKIVVDSLCEPGHSYQQIYPDLDNPLVLENRNWFWYSESFNCLRDSAKWNYVPDKTYQYLSFMPMNIRRPHRDQLVEIMEPFLDSFIWSYVDHPLYRKQLPNDKKLDYGYLSDDRHFDPTWYNQTCFSLVAESAVELPTQSVFVTEKTFKPIAFRHPFMIFGLPFTLKYLRSQGFETYENLFDESYDLEIDTLTRLEILKDNVKNYNNVPYDIVTQQKIEHNYNHFFNTELIKQCIRAELCEPLIDYVETR